MIRTRIVSGVPAVPTRVDHLKHELRRAMVTWPAEALQRVDRAEPRTWGAGGPVLPRSRRCLVGHAAATKLIGSYGSGKVGFAEQPLPTTSGIVGLKYDTLVRLVGQKNATKICRRIAREILDLHARFEERRNRGKK